MIRDVNTDFAGLPLFILSKNFIFALHPVIGVNSGLAADSRVVFYFSGLAGPLAPGCPLPA